VRDGVTKEAQPEGLPVCDHEVAFDDDVLEVAIWGRAPQRGQRGAAGRGAAAVQRDILTDDAMVDQH